MRGDGAFVFSGLHVDDTSAQVQTALSRVVKGVGGLSHASWRSFVNDRKTADAHGFKAARAYIAMIKVAAPRMALKIIDEAIQAHGAHGVGQDCKLPGMYTNIRTLRVADGPDIVHLQTIAKAEFAKPLTDIGKSVSGINTNIEKYGKFKHLADAGNAKM